MPIPYPHPTNAAVSAVMRGNRKRGTRPELRLASTLDGRGHTYEPHLRLDVTGLRVRPDLVFPASRLAVFVDGCFWHCCPTHGTRPRSNIEYWTAKLARNVERDHRVDQALADDGWKVLRIWEHLPAEDAAKLVESALLDA